MQAVMQGQAVMQEQAVMQGQEAMQEQEAMPMDIGPDIGDRDEDDVDKFMVIKPLFYNNINNVWSYEGDEEERTKIINTLNHSVNGKYVEFRSYFLVHYSDDYFEEMDMVVRGVLRGEEIQLGFDLLQIVEGKYDELDLEDPEYVAALDDLINNDCYADEEQE